jgi:hypothetical protein
VHDDWAPGSSAKETNRIADDGFIDRSNFQTSLHNKLLNDDIMMTDLAEEIASHAPMPASTLTQLRKTMHTQSARPAT